MTGKFLAAAAIAFSLVAGSAATAQTVSNNPAVADQGLVMESVSPAWGQALTPVNSRLDTYTVYLSGPGEIIGKVYEWNGTSIVGGPLWTGAPVAVGSGSSVPHVFSPGLTVDPAKTYLLVAEKTVASSNFQIDIDVGNGFAGGDLAQGDRTTFTASPGLDLRFSATFSAAAPATVPTMGEWAMILLGLMLAGGGVAAVTFGRYGRA